jgi:hypothetical protein
VVPGWPLVMNGAEEDAAVCEIGGDVDHVVVGQRPAVARAVSGSCGGPVKGGIGQGAGVPTEVRAGQFGDVGGDPVGLGEDPFAHLDVQAVPLDARDLVAGLPVAQPFRPAPAAVGEGQAAGAGAQIDDAASADVQGHVQGQVERGEERAVQGRGGVGGLTPVFKDEQLLVFGQRFVGGDQIARLPVQSRLLFCQLRHGGSPCQQPVSAGTRRRGRHLGPGCRPLGFGL